MVVQARDSYAVAEGLSGDAFADMPPEPLAPMPEADDAAVPSDEVEDDGAASPDADTDVVPSPDPDEVALRESLTAEVRAALAAEYEDKFRTDKRNLQQSLTKQQQGLIRQLQQLQARERARETWDKELLEQGLDPREIDRRENQAYQAERQVEAQWAQAQAEKPFVMAEVKSRHEANMQKYAYRGGQQLFDPNAPEVRRAQAHFDELVERHYDLEGGAQGTFLHRQIQQYGQALTNWYEQLSNAGVARLATPTPAPDPAKAARQNKSLKTQTTRGPQAASRASGAAPVVFDPEAVVAKAWADFPDDEAARLNYVKEQRARAQPQRR